MKFIGTTIIYSGKQSVFGSGMAPSLVGKELPNGKVVSATQLSPDEIELVIEFDLAGPFSLKVVK